jgi:hypothetical protein
VDLEVCSIVKWQYVVKCGVGSEVRILRECSRVSDFVAVVMSDDAGVSVMTVVTYIYSLSRARLQGRSHRALRWLLTASSNS